MVPISYMHFDKHIYGINFVKFIFQDITGPILNAVTVLIKVQTSAKPSS